MAIGHQRWVGFGLASAACALFLFGCESPAEPAGAGRLELRLEPGTSYTLFGRFHVNAIEPWSPSRDIDFDAATSHALIDLPPGIFSLALGAGARLLCAGEDPAPFAPFSAARLVSAPPRVITIAPGELTTARIGFGAAPTLRGEARLEAAGDGPAVASQSAPAYDPCGTRVALVEPFVD
jgi:hypothetical protein